MRFPLRWNSWSHPGTKHQTFGLRKVVLAEVYFVDVGCPGAIVVCRISLAGELCNEASLASRREVPVFLVPVSYCFMGLQTFPRLSSENATLATTGDVKVSFCGPTAGTLPEGLMGFNSIPPNVGQGRVVRAQVYCNWNEGLPVCRPYSV